MMGIHVCISTPQGREHPDWDSGRIAGDRDINAWMETVALVKVGDIASPDTNVVELPRRPIDQEAFLTLRTSIPTEHLIQDPLILHNRYTLLLNILEQNAEFGYYISH